MTDAIVHILRSREEEREVGGREGADSQPAKWAVSPTCAQTVPPKTLPPTGETPLGRVKAFFHRFNNKNLGMVFDQAHQNSITLTRN